MKKQLLSLIIFLLFISSVSAQTKEARKVDGFFSTGCEDMFSRVGNFYSYLQEEKEAKAYIIFYEGKHLGSLYNKKTKKFEDKLTYPMRNQASADVASIMLYLTKRLNFSKDRIVILDGGYKEEAETEFWIVSKGDQIPTPKPTLEKKDVKFRRGKARILGCGEIG